MGIRCADYVTPLYPQNLALTSPTGGGRSVGIVPSRTKATEFFFFSYTSKNIILIIGLVFSVFLGPEEHLKVSACPVAVWSVINEVHLSARCQGCYILFTPNNSPN